MSTNIEICGSNVPDCGAETLPLGNMCYPYTKTSEYSGDFVKYGLQTGSLAKPIIGTINLTSPYNCLSLCNQNNSCKGAQYNFQNAQCDLLGDQTTETLTDPTPSTSGCVNVYDREGGTNTSGISIVQGPNDVLNIDISAGIVKPNVQMIQGDYVGVNCRQQVANTSIDTNQFNSVLTGMGDFCKLNPNMKVCKEFCNNDNYADYCPARSHLLLYIFLSGFLATLIVFILLLRKAKKIPIIISGIIGIVFFGLFIWQVIDYIKNKGGYSGNTPDFPAEAVPDVKQSCATMWYNCNDWSQPYGSRCVPAKEGTGVFGKDECEAGGCCPPGFTPFNGTCYQSPPRGNVTGSCDANFHCSGTCPYPYTGGTYQPSPGRVGPTCTFISSARKGDVYCSGDKWTTCDNDSCPVDSLLGTVGQPVPFGCTWPPT